MITLTLEHIKELEQKVRAAVGLIESLKEENQLLNKKNSQYKDRIEELELTLMEYKDGQNKIEAGIQNALNQLERINQEKQQAESAPAEIQANPEAPLRTEENPHSGMEPKENVSSELNAEAEGQDHQSTENPHNSATDEAVSNRDTDAQENQGQDQSESNTEEDFAADNEEKQEVGLF